MNYRLEYSLDQCLYPDAMVWNIPGTISDGVCCKVDRSK